jgi:hypothetical protein
VYEGELDGRVFRATDVVTFPPDGRGIANAFTTSEHINFTGEYTSSTRAIPKSTFRLVGKKERVVIAPDRTLSSNK